MKEELNIDEWSRKEHFKYFSQFDEPFFGVCSDVHCSKAYQYCKEHDVHFSFIICIKH